MRALLQRLLARLRRDGRADPATRTAAPAPTRTPASTRTRTTAPTRTPAPSPRTPPAPRVTDRAPAGRHLAYSPKLDGRADPGEIVWTWVPFEDDPHRGKDRPVLVVGRQDGVLLGLMLSSKAARDGQQDWFALGSGAWDADDRPSWIRLDRVLRVAEDGIRREGAILDRPRFDAVAQRLRAEYGWA